MSSSSILIYLFRRDLRVSDNPILHHLASSSDHGFTHLLPVYVFPAHQVEISGFVKGGGKSPYPEARSQVGHFWRTGPHRAKFIAESVWGLKESFEKLDSRLFLRVGSYEDVLKGIIDGLRETKYTVRAVWLTAEEGVEEKRDEKAVSSLCSASGIAFRAWTDEKYFTDDRDLPLKSAKDLPDVFTSYRKLMEPLREKPRATLPKPSKASLPKSLPEADVPPQEGPFQIPTSYRDLEEVLLKPVRNFLSDPPPYPEGAVSAHPFRGGETEAAERLDEIIKSGVVYKYKDTRNGLIGAEFSTKLSAYLALGNISARQIHAALITYEDGTGDKYANAEGYGRGENEGSKAVRFELLWRDYMRLCTRKFTYRLFRLSGFRNDQNPKWKTPTQIDPEGDKPPPKDHVGKTLQRILEGTTGMGLIDASQRELLHTGYTSNRARQNVASFLAKHLGIDWRFGAEWYEMLLVDYDVSSNWANWQYVSGVGNDPRGEARIFNPVKQAFDYDKEGKYVRCWVPELRSLENLENVFQACTTSQDDWDKHGLVGLQMVEEPVKKIEFSLEGRPKNPKRPFDRRRKDGRIRSGANVSQTGHHGPPHHSYNKSADGQQQFYSSYNNPGNFRADFRGGFRGGRGVYRGRGYGSSRGGHRGGRGQFPRDGHMSNVPVTWPNSTT